MRSSSLLASLLPLFSASSVAADSLRHRTLQSDDDFGLVPVQNKIVGGTQADSDDYPYIVNLGGCGGSLIAPDVVLTAAHCQPGNPWSALVGGGTYTSGQLRFIERGSATPHPRYRRNTNDNDFMLYKLTRSSTKTPVALNTNSAVPSGEDVLTVIGFGSTKEGGDASFFLNKVDVNHVSYAKCNLAYFARIDQDIMFCAGVDGGGKDSCQGDSGGPIVNQDGVLLGVTSWGNGCGKQFFPGVYARVSGAIDWIQQETCKMSDDPPLWCDGVEIAEEDPNQSAGDSGQSDGLGGFWNWLTGLFGF